MADPVPRFASVRLDQAAMLTAVGEALPRILGRGAGELAGRRLLDFVHPDDHNRALAGWLDLLGSPGAVRRDRHRYRHGGGHWVWLELTVHNGLPKEIRADLVDVSGEEAAREALRANEEVLHRLADAVPLGVLHVGSTRDVVYRNRRIAHLTESGPALDALVAAIDPTDRAGFEAALTAALDHGADARLDIGYRHPEHGQRRGAVTVQALHSGGPEHRGALVSLADVTDDAALRAELADRARLDPLTQCHSRESILAALETLLDAGRSGPGVGLIFVDLQEAGDHLVVQVADRLLTAARDSDLVGRLGDDQFLVVCPGVAGAAEAVRIGERISFVLGTARVELDGEWVLPKVSIGVAWSPPASGPAQSLVERARRGTRTWTGAPGAA